jgi:hypothetical protein
MFQLFQTSGGWTRITHGKAPALVQGRRFAVTDVFDINYSGSSDLRCPTLSTINFGPRVATLWT